MTKIDKTTRHCSICKTVRVKDLTYFVLGTLFILFLNQANFSINEAKVEAMKALVQEMNTNIDHLDMVSEMPPNSEGLGVHELDRYRASYIYHLKTKHVTNSDAADVYGPLPLKRLGEGLPVSDIPLHDTFHMVFTTPPETVTWRVVRAVEAIFYHHPNAKVIMHSKTLPQVGSPFDIFAETGYNFVISFYDFEQLVKDSEIISDEDTEQLLNVLEVRRTGPHWYSHETDLLRMLLMYESGGVYLDTDQHIVQSFPKAFDNVLGWQDDGDVVNGSVMIFDKNGTFIRHTLEVAVISLFASMILTTGKLLVSNVCWQDSKITGSIALVLIVPQTFKYFIATLLNRTSFVDTGL